MRNNRSVMTYSIFVRCCTISPPPPPAVNCHRTLYPFQRVLNDIFNYICNCIRAQVFYVLCSQLSLQQNIHSDILSERSRPNTIGGKKRANGVNVLLQVICVIALSLSPSAALLQRATIAESLNFIQNPVRENRHRPVFIPSHHLSCQS